MAGDWFVSTYLLAPSVISGEPPSAYSVFDGRGVWLGDVGVPPGLRHWYRDIDVAGDFFLGVWVDESGVEEVRSYAIEKAQPDE